jgi:uncharacterized protein YxeA
MFKKTLPLIIIAVIIIVLAVLIFWQKPAQGVTFFYGQECPHCQVVEAYIKDNNISNKIKINELEVFHNQDNANQMAGIAKKCGIDTTQLGVPLLWDGTKCYEGQEEAINFFQQYK